MSKELWARAASKIIKAEISKRDLTYKQLSGLLKEMGIDESEGDIKAKLSRGAFSVIFFLQVLRVMGVQNLSLDDIFFQE